MDGIIANNGVCHTKVKCIKHAQIKNIKVNNIGRIKKKRRTVPHKEDPTQTFMYNKTNSLSDYFGNFKSKAVSSDGNFV